MTPIAPESPKPATAQRGRVRMELIAAVLVLVPIIGLGVVLLRTLTDDLDALSRAGEHDRRLALSAVATEALRTGDVRTLRAYLDAITAGTEVDGVVVFDAESGMLLNSWGGGELERNMALAKLLHSDQEHWPIDAAGSRLGFVTLVRGRDLGASTFGNLQKRVWLLAGLAVSGLILLPLLASRLARGVLSERLDALCLTADQLASGNYGARLPTVGTSALGKLGRSFNRMAIDLERQLGKLRESEERFELATSGSNEAIWDWDLASSRIFLSRRFADILGHDDSHSPRLFNALERLIHPDDLYRFEEALEGHLNGERAFRCELRFKTRQDTWVWMLARGEAVRDRAGVARRMVGSFADIRDQKEAQSALAAERARAEVTLASILDGVIATDVDGLVQYMNRAAERLTGWASSLAQGMDLLKVFNVSDDQGGVVDREVIGRVLAGGPPETFFSHTILRDIRGERYLIEEILAPMRDSAGQVIGMVVSFHDLTERAQLADALAREKEQALITLNAITDGVITTGRDGRVLHMNPAAEEMTGWPLAEAKGRSIAQVARFVEAAADGSKDLLGALVDQSGYTLDLGQATLARRTGGELQIERQVAPLRDSKGGISGAVVSLHNVSERHKLLERLSHQARHDALTDLINRYEFGLRLGQAIKRAHEESGLTHVVCYLDLDQFKIINDSCGHRAGDELLRQIAGMLEDRVRAGDTLARLGGDEFGLLLDGCGLDEAKGIAENLRQAVERFRFGWERQYFTLSVSIGLYLLEGAAESVENVFSALDEACYIAKNKGRNQIHVHQSDDAETSHWHNEVEWVPHIHSALDEGRFLLFAQPIAPIDGRGRSGHYEILLRMRDQRGQIVSPATFMPAAERYGLMPILDRWVVDSAVEAIARVRRKSGASAAIDTVGINISGAVLSDDSFLDHVKWVIDKHEIPPRLLCFEITETLAITNFALALHFIEELKAMGCRFALDDFGSGFASFNNLRNLPVDYLKIDGSFVREMMHKKVDHAMVEAINRIGHIMELETIAEFVEDAAILEALKSMGVDYAQGYHIGRPEPLFDVVCTEILRHE